MGRVCNNRACNARQAHLSTHVLWNSANIVSGTTMASMTLYHPKPVDSDGVAISSGFAVVAKYDSMDFSIISTMVGIDAKILVAKLKDIIQ